MITPRETLQLALVDFIDEKMTKVAIINNESGPRPPGLYATIGAPIMTMIGHAEVEYQNEEAADDLDETISQLVSIQFSVLWTREGAEDALEEFKMRVQSSSGRSFLLERGLAYVEMSPSRDLTSTVDAVRERRAQADITYYTVQSLTDTVTAIEALDIITKYRGRMADFDDVIQLEKP